MKFGIVSLIHESTIAHCVSGKNNDVLYNSLFLKIKKKERKKEKNKTALLGSPLCKITIGHSTFQHDFLLVSWYPEKSLLPSCLVDFMFSVQLGSFMSLQSHLSDCDFSYMIT